MQIISSYQWDLQLGDIKSPPEAVLEVVGNVYGQNDAPCAWYCTFNDEAVQSGWLRSKLDSCLYFPRDDQSRLCGIVGVHVDDTAVGGCAPVFEKAVAKPKSRFPYRKWRTQIGEFCGALYRQDPPTKAISMSQQTFAGSLKHASTPKGTDNGKSLNESQKSAQSYQRKSQLVVFTVKTRLVSSDQHVSTRFSKPNYQKPTRCQQCHSTCQAT